MIEADPRLEALTGADAKVMLTTKFDPDRGAVLHYEFDDPTKLPYSFGFPTGFEADGITTLPDRFDEHGYLITYPVREQERWVFEVALSADVYVAPEAGRLLWISPTPEHHYCAMPPGVGE